MQLSPIMNKEHGCIGAQKAVAGFECLENNLKRMDRLDFMVVVHLLLLAKLSIRLRLWDWARLFRKSDNRGIVPWRIQR